jgi:hypothetical protein
MSFRNLPGLVRARPELKTAHLNLTSVLGSISNCKAADLDISGQGGFFFESEEAMTGEVAGDKSVDLALVHLHGVDKLDLRPFLHEEAFADDFSGDFSAASQD